MLANKRKEVTDNRFAVPVPHACRYLQLLIFRHFNKAYFMSDKIFYSWQSDLPNRTNRGLIQSALEKTAKDLRSDESIAIDPVVDRDTLSAPGAPDIAATIFRKIDESTAFVCDVSIVCRPKKKRPCPNPNVLLELGYALKSISSERTILVFNTASGDISELPFDLKFRRVLTYQMHEDDKPSHVRDQLRNKFKNALREIFEHLEEISRDEEKGAYLSSLNQTLTKIILFGEESMQRVVNPWAQEVVDIFGSAVKEVRESAADEVAVADKIVANLETLADQLDEVLDFHKGVGSESYNNFNVLVDNAVDTAWQIKKRHIDNVPLSEDSKQQVSKRIEKKIRMLRQWVARYERSDENMRGGIFQEFLSNVSKSGYALLQISYYAFNKLNLQLLETLRNKATNLHLIELQYELSGSSSGNELVKEVKRLTSAIESLFKGIV